MNVQIKTPVHALRSAATLQGALGVSVRKAISWKKTEKHAPRAREVSLDVFSPLCLSRAHLEAMW